MMAVPYPSQTVFSVFLIAKMPLDDFMSVKSQFPA